MALHQYNSFKYNTAQYNADATFWVRVFTEAIGSADVDMVSKAAWLTEALSSTDTRTAAMARSAAEFLFVLDTVSKSFLNKGFPETVRINDWLQIERKRNSQWGN